MISIPNQLAPMLGTLPAWVLPLAMLIVALLLIFPGRTVVKVVAFLIVGLIGASIGGLLGAQYLTGLGDLGPLLGVLLGFIIGGIIGVAILAVGIGLAVGYAAYLLALDLVSSTTTALIVGFVFFIIGVALYGKTLTIITALAGGLLFFYVLRYAGLGLLLSTVLAATVTLVGIWVQYGLGGKKSQPTKTQQ